MATTPSVAKPTEKANQVPVAEPQLYIDRESIKILDNKKMTKKKVGRDPQMVTENNKNIAVFLSDKKELLLFKTDTDLIKFSQSHYLTDNAEDIAFLENHEMFGRHIFRDKFPESLVKKMKNDAQFITRSDELLEKPDV